VRHVEEIPFDRIRPAKATAQEKKFTDMQVGFGLGKPHSCAALCLVVAGKEGCTWRCFVLWGRGCQGDCMSSHFLVSNSVPVLVLSLTAVTTCVCCCRCCCPQHLPHPQTALQTADKQTIVGSLKDMLYKRRMERELLRAKGEFELCLKYVM
jgi:hypothetical protein